MHFPVLEGKVAIVTGAAMGMGKATAILFAASGAKVVVADRDEEGARRTVGEIETAGGKAHPVGVDVSDSAQVAAMVAETVSTFGQLDVAVNNAAVKPDDSPAHDFDEDYWDRLLAVDLNGCYERKDLPRGGTKQRMQRLPRVLG